MLLRVAFFSLILSAVPGAASAQTQDSLLCKLLPSLCQTDGGGSSGGTAVPELDGNAAGSASALVLGAALLLGARRRRSE